jgi:type IV secretory pathway VirJ component
MRKVLGWLTAALLIAGLGVGAWWWRSGALPGLAPAGDAALPSGSVPPGAAPAAPGPVTQAIISHGRFKHLTLFSPATGVRGVVLLLSTSAGWDANLSTQATALAARGALVVGIDLRLLNEAMAADGATCEYPDGDLENLSHWVQAYQHLPTYLSPVVAGVGAGGTFAYAMLAQAPVNTFAGAVSAGFCPIYPLDKPLCKGSGLESTPQPKGGVAFAPAHLGNPWVALPAPDGADCAPGVAPDFVGRVPGARWTGDAEAFTASIEELMKQSAPAAAAAEPAALKDLPLVLVPAAPAPAAAASAAPSTARGPAPTGDLFAVMLSGDGGWAGIDKEVAAALAADGIPVVGLDSLRYFWTPRTPEGLAADLDRIVNTYAALLSKSRVMLIGYSQGADVLPFALNRVKPETRARIALAAILGMSEHALFEFHMTNWIADDNSGPATLPEVNRISGIPVLCIYGEEETDSLCPHLDPRAVTIVKLKGGHHFDGNYASLAQTILAARP